VCTSSRAPDRVARSHPALWDTNVATRSGSHARSSSARWMPRGSDARQAASASAPVGSAIWTAPGIGSTHGCRNLVANSVPGVGNTGSTKQPSEIVKNRPPGGRPDHVVVDAGAAHPAEAIVDAPWDAEGLDPIDLKPVVAARVAGDGDHLVLAERGRRDEHVARPSLAEIAVAGVDVTRLALHGYLHPTAGTPSRPRCHARHSARCARRVPHRPGVRGHPLELLTVGQGTRCLVACRAPRGP
jgi:hypothetical protein